MASREGYTVGCAEKISQFKQQHPACIHSMQLQRLPACSSAEEKKKVTYKHVHFCKEHSNYMHLRIHRFKDRLATIVWSRGDHTLANSYGKRSWKMRLIFAPPLSSRVSTLSPLPSMAFSKSAVKLPSILN